MWHIFSGWRKASKCKKLIDCLRCRLKFLRDKRNAIVQYVRGDIAQLLSCAHHQAAFFRVELLVNDYSILAAYDLLENYCDFILLKLPYIRKHRDCPSEIKEAISTLIFAAARCGDLPELPRLRELFGKRYGNDFVVAAEESFPGSLVNQQISEMLSTRPVSDDERFELIEGIAVEYAIQLWQPEIGDGSNQQYRTDDIVKGLGCNPRCVQGIDILENDIQVVYHDISKVEETLAKSYLSRSSSETTSNLVAAGYGPVKKRMKLIRSQDEISTAHCYCKRKPVDQTLRKVSVDGQNEQSRSSADSGYESDDFFGTSGSLSPESHIHDSTMPVTNSINDVECASYYEEECDCSDFDPPNIRWGKSKEESVHFFSRCNDLTQNKHWVEISSEGRENSMLRSRHAKKKAPSPQQSNFRSKKKPVKKSRNHSHCHMHNSARRSYSGYKCHHGTFADCSLGHPCYFLTGDEKDDSNAELHTDLKHRSCFQGVANAGGSVSGSSGHRGMQISKAAQPLESVTKGSSLSSSSMDTQTQSLKPPHQRAMAMPLQGQPKTITTDQNLRSPSFQFKQESKSCAHVHPKLPDYDGLAAKFIALRKEYFQRNAMAQAGYS